MNEIQNSMIKNSEQKRRQNINKDLNTNTKAELDYYYEKLEELIKGQPFTKISQIMINSLSNSDGNIEDNLLPGARRRI